MLNKLIRILNFDNSVIAQKKLLSQYKTEIIDLEDIALRARYWINARTKRLIQERIHGLDRNCVSFIGSGDFHHISSILINQFSEPLTLLVFDFHPDWDAAALSLSCGSWVTDTLKNKNILKCLLLGPSSNDISTWGIQSANLSSLKDNRVEIYPYARKPSIVFLKRVPHNISLRLEKGFLHNRIYWEELRGKNLPEFFLSLIQRLPTKQVYVSIDKDCLKNDSSLTNWEEGVFSLDELLSMLRIIRENLDIVGVDISGDYSKVWAKERIKAFFSRLDRPKGIKAKELDPSVVTATNEATNLKILETLLA